MRVLHIISHTPYDTPRFKLLLHEGWQARTARELAKREPSFSVESWMPAFVPKTYSFKKNGVIYRVFPAQKRLDGLGGTTSKDLLNSLPEDKDDTILHVHGDRAILAYSILRAGSNKKFVQHHGSFGFSVLTPLEMLVFRKIEKFYANSRLKQKYLKRIGLGEDKVRIQPVGVDFDFFRHRGKDQSRLRLGLRSNGKMLLYVGRFDKSKGLDAVINAYITLKKKNDVFLVAIGGADSDPLFVKLCSVGAQIFGRVPPAEMPYFYSAADVMCYYWERLYGGVIVSVVEALACDTPTVSNTLGDFINKDEIPRVGLIPESTEDMARKIQDILEGRHEFTCRKTAEKYYTWEKIINLTVRDYKGDS